MTVLSVNGVDVAVPGGKLGLCLRGRAVLHGPSKVECRREAKTTADGRIGYWYYWYMDGRGRFASGTEAARALHALRDGRAVVVRGRVASVIASRCLVEAQS